VPVRIVVAGIQALCAVKCSGQGASFGYFGNMGIVLLSAMGASAYLGGNRPMNTLVEVVNFVQHTNGGGSLNAEYSTSPLVKRWAAIRALNTI
jgi:hypothetical protein